MQNFSIIETKTADQDAVEHLLDLSFGIDRHVKTSYRLREGSQPVEGLSLVARSPDSAIMTTISFWPLAIGPKLSPALLLGPLAVHPDCKNRGLGLALMREGLARAKAMGHRLVILVGDEPYYARVGFARLPRDLLLMPGPVDAERFLFLELASGSLHGVEGLVLPPHRASEALSPLAVPHAAHQQKECCEA